MGNNTMTGKPSTSESKVAAYFPIVQWVWTGLFAIAMAVGITLYNLKVESIEMRHKVELQKQIDNKQDEKIKALAESIKSMSAAQRETTNAINALSFKLEQQNHRLLMIAEETKKANELQSARLDSHIALSKAQNKN